MVGCNMRFHPGPAAVKKLLETGIIGAAIASRIQVGSYLPRWRPQQEYRQDYSASPQWGGAILDCIHELDLALWYFGPAEVFAAAHLAARAISLETDGLAEAILNHESRVLTSVHMNFVQRDYHRSCQVIGNKGTIYWDFGEREVRVYGLEGELVQTHPEPDKWELNQMYLDEVEHFLRAVQSGTETTNPLSGGKAALELALSIRRIGAVWRS
jgi:predicted dehydrogenase